jgi:hypothetical protein
MIVMREFSKKDGIPDSLLIEAALEVAPETRVDIAVDFRGGAEVRIIGTKDSVSDFSAKEIRPWHTDQTQEETDSERISTGGRERIETPTASEYSPHTHAKSLVA